MLHQTVSGVDTKMTLSNFQSEENPQRMSIDKTCSTFLKSGRILFYYEPSSRYKPSISLQTPRRKKAQSHHRQFHEKRHSLLFNHLARILLL